MSLFNYYVKTLLLCIGITVSSVELVLADEPVKKAKGIKGLVVSKATMPSVPPVSRTSAVYLSFENQSENTILIDSVSTPIAHHSMFHLTTEVDGVAKMNHLEHIQLLPSQSIVMQQGGMHIMLMGLQAIPESGIFELRLHSGEQISIIEVKVSSRRK